MAENRKKIRLRTPTAEEEAILDALVPVKKISMWEIVRSWTDGSVMFDPIAFPTPWGWQKFLDLYERKIYDETELERRVREYWKKIGYDGMFRPVSIIVDKYDKGLFV